MSLNRIIANARSLDLRATTEQRRLSARHLTPRLDEVLQRLAAFREAVDQGFAPRIAAARAQPNPDQVYGDRDWAHYPIGFCQQIRDGVLERMRADSFFQDLVARGLTLKPVFIFLQDRYFQNAIQFGNLYLDAANDTVSPEKPKLEWAPIERVDYENLESWSRFADIARRYLKIEIFPNLSFPLAFAACPFFAIRSNGRIELLLAQHQIALKDMADGMRRTLALLDDETLMTRRLPTVYAELLEKAFGANLLEAFPLEFAPTSLALLREGVLREFIELQKQPEAVASPIVSGYFELIEKAAHLLRARDLRPAPHQLELLRRQGVLPAAATSPQSLILE